MVSSECSKMSAMPYACVLVLVAINLSAVLGDQENDSHYYRGYPVPDSLDSNAFVATTPKIPSTRSPNRYEQGLEDYEEAAARVDQIKEDQKTEMSDNFGKLIQLFNMLSSIWNVASPIAATRHTRSSEDENQAEIMENEQIDGSNQEGVAPSEDAESTEVAEGRYIKGDPLKGYYDFIITEGSYKFWATFQLFTAGLMIYSTFAAIYYSKVNPIVGDYDYTSYLGGARSLADDPDQPQTSMHPLTEVANSYWFQQAAHGFQFVLDAIEKMPAET